MIARTAYASRVTIVPLGSGLSNGSDAYVYLQRVATAFTLNTRRVHSRSPFRAAERSASSIRISVMRLYFTKVLIGKFRVCTQIYE